MRSSSVLRNLTSIAVSAYCVIGVANLHGQTYNLTNLGVIPGQEPGSSSVPSAINGKEQVAGTSGPSAFRYTNAKDGMKEVGGNRLKKFNRGLGINSSGQVVGDSTFGADETSHAAIFSDQSTIDLGTLPNRGLFSRANGINALGTVIGFSSETRDGKQSRAFILHTTANRSRMIDLGTLGGSYAQAWAINDSGSVTGNSQIISTSGPADSHAFIWHAETGMLDLGTLAGRFSYGTAINANGHIVGHSTISKFDDRVHAFLYNGEEMRDLGSLSGAALDTDLSFALGINATDQVVGYTYLPMGTKQNSTDVVLGPWSVAFVYSEGLMQNLNDLIGTASENYRLDSATAINDNGQIVAIAFDNSAGAFRAVLLTLNSSDSIK